MDPVSEQSDQRRLVAVAIEATIRVAVIGALVYWCLRIVGPFLMPLLWGAIIAVAVYPGYTRLAKVFRFRKGWAATVMTVSLLLLLFLPVLLLTGTMVDGVRAVAADLRDGTLSIPPPPEGVSAWPIIGKEVAAVWTSASQNLPGLIAQLGPAALDAGKWLLSGAASVGVAVIMFVVSVIVAGVLLAYSEGAAAAAHSFATRLAGDGGPEFVKTAESTVRSVAVGILGIAFIQATLAGLGMLVAGIPGAGLWAFICLILSITQIGGLPVLLPAAIYLFATGDTMPAVLFSIWAVVIGLSDNILRPLLLGRGAGAPMLVVLIGSIGGLLAEGVVGLFVGAVIFTLGYKLFVVWLQGNA